MGLQITITELSYKNLSQAFDQLACLHDPEWREFRSAHVELTQVSWPKVSTVRLEKPKLLIHPSRLRQAGILSVSQLIYNTVTSAHLYMNGFANKGALERDHTKTTKCTVPSSASL